MDSQDLFGVALKDSRRFRRAVVGCLIVIAAGLLIFGVGAFNIASKNNQLLRKEVADQAAQLKQQGQASIDIERDNKAELQLLQNHIDCIVSLFTQPTRTDLVISDITSCQLGPVGASGSSGSATTVPKASSPTPVASSQAAAPSKTTAPTTPSSPAPKPGLIHGLLNFIEGL